MERGKRGVQVGRMVGLRRQQGAVLSPICQSRPKFDDFGGKLNAGRESIA